MSRHEKLTIGQDVYLSGRRARHATLASALQSALGDLVGDSLAGGLYAQ